MVRAGLVVGVTVINDVGLANALAPFVPYTVLRVVYTDHDDHIRYETGYAGGYGAFTDPFWWSTYSQADPRVILQYANETDYGGDNDWNIGLMVRASETGRKVVIFNDSVGWTEDNVWLARKPALKHCLDAGHYVGLHAYGTIDAFFHPVSAYDDPGAWRWYGGRFQHLYEEVMPDVQPPLIITEIGPGKSEWQHDRGFDVFWRDVDELERRVAGLNYLKSYHWWTCGGKNGYQFDGDCIDDWLPEIAQRLQAMKQPVGA